MGSLFNETVLAAAVAGTVVAAAQPASAQIEIPAGLTTPERAMWVGIESAASLVASIVTEKLSCGGSYDLHGIIVGIDPNDDGADDSVIGGRVWIDERDIHIDVEVVDNQRGTNILVSTAGSETVGGESIAGLRGDYWYSPDSAIMYGDAVFRINDDPWDERITTDLFVGTVQVGQEPATLGIRGEGIAVTTKRDSPATKWLQVSENLRIFGVVPGPFEVEKHRQEFLGGSTCVIRTSGWFSTDFADGAVRMWGDVTVSRF